MVFVRIIPRTRKNEVEKTVRISFGKQQKNGGCYANIYIGHNILEKIGLQKSSKAFISYDQDNPKKWLIERDENNSNDSYQLTPASKGNKYSKVAFMWNQHVPDNKKIQNVEFNIEGNKLLITNK